MEESLCYKAKATLWEGIVLCVYVTRRNSVTRKNLEYFYQGTFKEFSDTGPLGIRFPLCSKSQPLYRLYSLLLSIDQVFWSSLRQNGNKVGGVPSLCANDRLSLHP